MDDETSSLDVIGRVIQANKDAADRSVQSDKYAVSTATERIIEANKDAADKLVQTDHCAASELIEANSQAALRNRALTLSNTVTIGIIAAEIYFSYTGKSLVMPDVVWQIIWAVILAPWLGAGSSKLLDLFSRVGLKINGNGKK